MVEIGNAKLYTGDVLEWAASYDGEPFHALLCDPPYHLTSISKRFGAEGAAQAQFGKDGAFQRASAGFMGQQWDGGDIAFRPETWAALGRHLHPGAFCMAFAGTRGYHRMACAIEDAGFVLHPMMCWAFGSGFPKATRILAREYERTAEKSRNGISQRSRVGDMVGGVSIPGGQEFNTLAPASDMAARWQGHRYGLQALKPALEPICVFQKPYKGRPLDCITKSGSGALNIDAGRVGTSADSPQIQGTYRGSEVGIVPERDGGTIYTDGRWPSNLILDEQAAASLDAQSGISVSRGGKPVNLIDDRHGWKGSIGSTTGGLGDEGGASRFYHVTDWQAELLEADPVRYAAKAGREERNAGLERHRTSESADPGALRDGNRVTMPRQNVHPTVKPLRLTEYLSRLLLPPAEYGPRRILVPFAGSGSEMIGTMLAGWEQAVGIEQSAEYAEIAAARLAFWQCNSGLFAEITAESEEEEASDAQGRLF